MTEDQSPSRSMSTDMIERVARAIIGAIGSPYPYDDAPEEFRVVWRMYARAALEAMRAPTPGMIDAMRETPQIWTDPDVWVKVYQVAIDAALGRG